MIRRASEKKVEKSEHKFGAEGFVTIEKLINSDEELNGKGRVFSHITVAPHSGMGYHVHNGDMEIYYVLSGKATYNDNGTMTTIETGDVTFTLSGMGHEIINNSDDPFEIIALVLYN